MKKKKKILIAVILIGSIIFAWLGARAYILSQVKTAFNQKLEEWNKSGINVRYDSINVQWFKNIIVIDQLLIRKNGQDTCIHPQSVSVERVTIKGLSLWTLLTKKEFKITEVDIDKPHIIVRENSKLFSDTVSKKETKFALSINRLLLTSAQVEYMDSASCELKTEFHSTIIISGIDIQVQPKQPFEFAVNTIVVDNTILKFPKKLYTLQIKKASVNLPKGIITLDTMRITPDAPKLTFSKKLGHRTNRVEGVIPFVKLSGFRYQYPDSFSLQATNMSIQFFLKVFFDRRLPHTNNDAVAMPMQQIQRLPFGLAIDSLQVVKSYVSYEEMSPNAETGLVFFDNMKAAIVNINNNKQLKGKTHLKAQASFMGQGDLKFSTSLAWQPNENCDAEGYLKRFNFSKVNTMLKLATNMEFQSGTLDLLTFKWVYNNTRSNGKVELNYHDLKLVSFKDNTKKVETDKEKQGKITKGNRENKLETFVINKLLLQKNMDEKDAIDKRTGTIFYYRDTTRPIFNYWWRSVLSGIRSTFHVDQLDIKQQIKKKKK